MRDDLLSPERQPEDVLFEGGESAPPTTPEPEPERVKAEIPLPEVLKEDDDHAQGLDSDYDLIYDLIRCFPTDLGHLAGIPVKLLFRKKKWVSKGAQVLYKPSVFPPKDAFIHPYRFLVIINATWWQANQEKRRAMMFDALYSCWRDDNDKCSIRHPDFSGFCATLQHFGPWNQGLHEMNLQLDPFNREQ